MTEKSKEEQLEAEVESLQRQVKGLRQELNQISTLLRERFFISYNDWAELMGWD